MNIGQPQELGNDIKNIERQRNFIKFRLILVTVLLYPTTGVSFAFSIIFNTIIHWQDHQSQRIEDLRVDIVYLKKYGQTHDEYYSVLNPTSEQAKQSVGKAESD
jgi:hypothetical protein